MEIATYIEIIGLDFGAKLRMVLIDFLFTTTSKRQLRESNVKFGFISYLLHISRPEFGIEYGRKQRLM
jgi:hypothetical protein